MDGLPKFANVMNEPRRTTEDEIELPPNGTSLDLLQAVYRNDQLPLVTRMRAAMACLPFEAPKLQVTAMVSEQGFAEILERRLKRIAALEASGANARVVNQRAVETKPPLPRISDRRFRRI